MLSVLHTWQHLLFCRAIAGQLIGDQHLRDVLTALEQLAKELLGSLFVASALEEDIEHIPMLINCAPQIVQFAVDFKKHLVEVPFITGLGTSTTELVGILLAKLLASLADGLVGHYDASGGHQLFDITIAEREAEVQPSRVRDDLGRKSIALIAGRGWYCCHAADHTTRPAR
jgi:hypothetical protein